MSDNPAGYTCDKCHRKGKGAAPVVLRGIAGRLGLNLPGELQERTFCGANCFWLWKGEEIPQAAAPPKPAPATEEEFEP